MERYCAPWTVLFQGLVGLQSERRLTGFSNAKPFDAKDTAINSTFLEVVNLELFAKECGLDWRDERGFIRGDLMDDHLEKPWHHALKRHSIAYTKKSGCVELWGYV